VSDQGPPTPAPWNRWPVFIPYLVIAVVMVAVFRLAGRGWIGALTAGIVLAGVVGTLVVLVGSRMGRRR
jgi:uncharacterized membrane protein YcaP (DUF421 family)